MFVDRRKTITKDVPTFSCKIDTPYYATIHSMIIEHMAIFPYNCTISTGWWLQKTDEYIVNACHVLLSTRLKVTTTTLNLYHYTVKIMAVCIHRWVHKKGRTTLRRTSTSNFKLQLQVENIPASHLTFFSYPTNVDWHVSLHCYRVSYLSPTVLPQRNTTAAHYVSRASYHATCGSSLLKCAPWPRCDPPNFGGIVRGGGEETAVGSVAFPTIGSVQQRIGAASSGGGERSGKGVALLVLMYYVLVGTVNLGHDHRCAWNNTVCSNIS